MYTAADAELRRIGQLIARSRDITAAAFTGYWLKSTAVQLIRAVVDTLLLVVDKVVWEGNRGNIHRVPAMRYMEDMQQHGTVY